MTGTNQKSISSDQKTAKVTMKRRKVTKIRPETTKKLEVGITYIGKLPNRSEFTRKTIRSSKEMARTRSDQKTAGSVREVLNNIQESNESDPKVTTHYIDNIQKYRPKEI